MNPLKLEERVLFIINDNTIHGSIRFQKYGFLLHKQYQRELLELGLSYDGFTFYEDWKPYHYGPYSEQLQKDITDCIDNNLVNKIPPNTNVRYNSYKLTLKGRVRWREFLKHTPDEIKRINNKNCTITIYVFL